MSHDRRQRTVRTRLARSAAHRNLVQQHERRMLLRGGTTRSRAQITSLRSRRLKRVTTMFHARLRPVQRARLGTRTSRRVQQVNHGRTPPGGRIRPAVRALRSRRTRLVETRLDKVRRVRKTTLDRKGRVVRTRRLTSNRRLLALRRTRLLREAKIGLTRRAAFLGNLKHNGGRASAPVLSFCP